MTPKEADRICDIMWQMDIKCGDIQTVREALEKQIPKKVNWIYGRGMGIAHCPVCDREVHRYMNGCPYCLHAIDWEDNE